MPIKGEISARTFFTGCIYFVLMMVNPFYVLASSSPVDSLKSELSAANADSCDIYYQMATWYNNHNSDSCIEIIDKALSLKCIGPDSLFISKLYWLKGTSYLILYRHLEARQAYASSLHYCGTNEPSQYLGRIYYKMALAEDWLENYDGSIEIYNKALRTYKAVDDTFNIGQTYLTMGETHYYYGYPDKALEHYELARPYFDQTGHKVGQGLVDLMTGSIYNKWGNYTLASDYIKSALARFEEIGDTSRMAMCLNRMGSVYLQMEFFSEARDYFYKSLELAESDNDIGLMSVLYNNIGESMLQDSLYDEANALFRKSLNLEYEMGNSIGVAETYISLTDLFIRMGAYDSALTYADHAMEIINEYRLDEHETKVLTIKANAYLEKQECSKALELNDIALVRSRNLNISFGIINTYYLRYRIYACMGDYASALKYMRIYEQYSDSVLNEEVYNQLSNLHASYENADKERQIAILRTEQEIQEMDIQANMSILSIQRKIVIISIIVLLIVSILSVMLFNMVRQKKLAHQALILQNNEIEVSKIMISKALERTRESDELKSAFLSNISKEIRRPVRSILEVIESGGRKYSTKENTAGIEKQVNKNGQLLLDMMSDIITQAKIEAHQIIISEKEINLPEFFVLLAGEIETFIKRKGLEDLVVKLDNENQQEFITTDENLLKIIFMQLLSNAVHATTKGEISFGTRKLRDKEVFFVADNGKGIPEIELERIWDRFYRLDDSTASEPMSSGLGLSIVKSLVELLGGSIWLESTIDKGSTFFFTIGPE